MPTDKKLNQLIINKLTAEQYAGIESPDPEQLYFVPDETDESLPPQAPEDKGKALLANGDGTASWKGVANAESANDWKEPQTFSGGAVADEIKSKSTGNSVLKTQKNTSGAWTLSVGSSARPTKVEGTEVDLAGALKAKDNGDVQVGKSLEVDGNILSGFIGKATIPIKQGDALIGTVDCWVGEGLDTSEGAAVPLYFAVSYMLNGHENRRPAISPIFSRYAGIADYDVCHTMDEVLRDGFVPYEFVAGYGGLMTQEDSNDISTEIGIIVDKTTKIEGAMSTAKHQHTVTLSGDGFEFCFTAMSSKNTAIFSYQGLVSVFGGERIGLTGYSAALSAKPVLINLQGGSESTDFIRVYEEASGGFSNKTLASIGAIRYDDYVCPK